MAGQDVRKNIQRIVQISTIRGLDGLGGLSNKFFVNNFHNQLGGGATVYHSIHTSS